MYCSARELILKAMTRLSTDSVDNLETYYWGLKLTNIFPSLLMQLRMVSVRVRLRDIDNMTNIAIMIKS